MPPLAGRACQALFWSNQMKQFLQMAMSVAACTLSMAALANDYPSRPIKMVVPVTPGGPNDIFARALGPRMAASLGQQIVVENQAGAGGNLATAAILRQPHDGYTLLLHGMTYAVNPSIYGASSPYAVKDYTTVSVIGKGPLVLVVHPSLGVKSVAELLALVKTRPAGIEYASGGTGTSPHLAAELFKNVSGANLLHIPYKGTSAFMPDLLAGRVPVAFVSPLVVKPYIQAGQLVGLGVTSARRSKGWDLPTIAESGLAGYDFDAWYAILTPAGTPAPVVTRLNAVIGEAMAAPEVVEKWNSLGMELVRATPAEAAAYVDAEAAKWAKVVKDANIKAE